VDIDSSKEVSLP